MIRGENGNRDERVDRARRGVGCSPGPDGDHETGSSAASRALRDGLILGWDVPVRTSGTYLASASCLTCRLTRMKAAQLMQPL